MSTLLYPPSLRGEAAPALSKQMGDDGPRFYQSPRTHLWYPSVTSVLKVVSAPALERWKTNALLDHLKDKATNYSITQYFKPQPGSTWSKRRQQIIKAADNRLYADRGTMVHTWAETKAAIECGHQADLPNVPETWAIWCEQWDIWRASVDIEWLGLEVTGFNDTDQYAGTIDFIAYLDGELVLGDYKTSSSIHRTYAAQLAALRHCEYLVSGDGHQHPVPKVDKCVVIQLRPGIRRKHVMNVEQGIKDFLAMRSLWTVYND